MRTLVRLLCTAIAGTALAQSQWESDDYDGASNNDSESDSDSSDSATGNAHLSAARSPLPPASHRL
jgi:hypothetical protein